VALLQLKKSSSQFKKENSFKSVNESDDSSANEKSSNSVSSGSEEEGSFDEHPVKKLKIM